MQKVPFLRRSKNNDGSRSATTSPSLGHTRQFSTSSLSISSPTGFVDAEQVFGRFPKPQVASPTMTQSQRWKRLRRPLSIISTASLTSLSNSSNSNIKNNENTQKNSARRPSIPRKPVQPHSTYISTTPSHSNSSSLSTNEADFKSHVTTIASEDEVAKEHLRNVLANQFAVNEVDTLEPETITAAPLPPPLTAPVIPKRSASRPKSQLFKVKRKSVHGSYGKGTANDLGTFIDLDNGSGLLDGIDTWISEGDAQFNNGLPSPTLGDEDDDSFESDDSCDADFSRTENNNESSALTGSSYNLYTQFLKNELPHDSDEDEKTEGTLQEQTKEKSEEELIHNSSSTSTLDELDIGDGVPGLIMSDASEISLPTTPSVSTFEHYHSNGIVWIGDAKEEDSVIAFDDYDNDQQFTRRTQPKWLYRQDRYLFRDSKPPRLSLTFA